MSDISLLYNENPQLYDLISNDRDFTLQVQTVISLVNSPIESMNIADLCAGPARHAIELNKMGVTSYAFDSSEMMKQYAVENLFFNSSHYIVSDIKSKQCFDCLENEDKFDLFLLLRYSVGYFSKEDLLIIINNCKNKAKSGSILILELHKLDIVRNNFKNLDIQARTFYDKKEHLYSCYWPNSEPQWDEYDLRLCMEVKITESYKENLIKSMVFYSKEYIHSVSDILFISNMLNLKCEVLNLNNAFGINSHLVGIHF